MWFDLRAWVSRTLYHDIILDIDINEMLTALDKRSNMVNCLSRQIMLASIKLLVLGALASTVSGLARFPQPKTPVSDSPTVDTYSTHWFQQDIDHFNYVPHPKWNHRYLVFDKHWGNFKSNVWSDNEEDKFPVTGCRGPVFFYTGNESPVDEYFASSGFINDVLAPKLGALVIYAEHRYFGKSLPFGPVESWKRDKMIYLSSEQALADYSVLLTSLRKTMPGLANCPIVAFGGSYGGMLTAWFRRLYPQFVIGGLAASAPIGFVGTGISPAAFDEASTNTYKEALPGCDTAITKAFSAMQQMITTPVGLAQLSKDFNLCQPANTQYQGDEIINFFVAGLVDASMVDYPSKADYGIPLGPWPVNNTCKVLLSELQQGTPIVQAAAKAAGVFYNHTGQYPCYNVWGNNPSGPVWGSGLGWPYLACTEVYLPSAGSGMYPHYAWNVTADKESCMQQFGVDLRPDWIVTHYGGRDWSAATNIIFSNGLLDPWHSAGILESPGPTLTAIVIAEAAHHLDLRGPTPNDPIYVQQARLQEESIIVGWFNDFIVEHQQKQQ